MSVVYWLDIPAPAGAVGVGVDGKSFLAAIKRVGVPATGDASASYPRWAQAAFWAGGEDGLRITHEAGAAGQAAVESALALGGKEAVAGVLQLLANPLPTPDALTPPGYP